ncbi:metal-dependent hydrolase [Pelodictyon luteolum]|uniref:Membrane protein, putative n=2 Tax=Pelodictyon luteolum TaxID=1100 RepID=Q3B338_CHLL3|nr:metal-dependent hydrolase [Pelodictyon luteolum]ABB24243.1 membrane protein, putative [Pelodictyon luteolum DSM 273]
MYFAHLPAGYITARLLDGRLCRTPLRSNTFMFWGMLGSIAPDFDFVWCFHLHQRLCDHHQYPTHYPLLWLGLLVFSVLWLLIARFQHTPSAFAVVFFFGGVIHTVLDMFTGHLFLLAPISFVRQKISLAEYGLWDPFFLELFIVLGALIVWKKEQLSVLLSKIS